MYHPYFRGKQFELITIRECAAFLARSGFVPIIEPVRESFGVLLRTLDAVCAANGNAVVIVNPFHGDLREGGVGISDLLQEKYTGSASIEAGILLREDMEVDEVLAYCAAHADHQLTFIHAGFTQGKALAEGLDESVKLNRNVFVEGKLTKLYTKNFKMGSRVLVRDGFKRQRNRDYPAKEPFSDLHVTYEEEGMDGFGDFLIVGDDYSDSGGPAYAVAIHLTFIDPDEDDAMFIYHFVSDRQDTPTDPAGKFAEALAKLMLQLESGTSKLYETEAITEFRELHKKGHFPGLGYVKKLSMKHHIETLSRFFE